MFLVLEGLDNSGKTTIINELKKIYKNNKKIIFTREPGGLKIRESEKIREILMDKKNVISKFTEFLLFGASRRIHYEKLIKPELEKNNIVISDRYFFSSWAYQEHEILNIEKIKEINDIICENLYPNFVFYFQIESEEALKRGKKKNDRINLKLEYFFSKVKKNYDDFFIYRKDVFIPKKTKLILINGSDSVIKIVKKISKIIDKCILKNERKE